MVRTLLALPAAAALCASVDWTKRTPTTETPGWSRCVGSGHAAFATRPDYKAQLKLTHDELGVEYVRFHAIFDDDVGSYIAPGQYNFTKVKDVYDTMVDIGMKPFVELSYMPEKLAACETTVFNYSGHTCEPKKYSDWSDLIEGFTRYLIATYGIDEVATWPFEVWNEPNCGFFTPSTSQPWQRALSCCSGCGDIEAYLELYSVTTAAIKKVSPRIQVGGPSSAQLGLMTGFLRRAIARNLPVDFVSSHLYPTDPVVVQEPSGFSDAVEGFVRQVHSYKPGVKIYLTEYNSGLSFPTNHDDSFAASSIIAFSADFVNRDVALDFWSYWTFSDIFSEGGWDQTPFTNAFGMMTKDGIRKPSWRALQLLNLPQVKDMGLKPVPVNMDGCGDGFMLEHVRGFARHTADGGIIYLTNHGSGPETDLKEQKLKINVKGIKKLYHLDGSIDPRGAWERMGAPGKLTDAQVQQLHKASEWREEIITQTGDDLTVVIPPYSVMAIEVVHPTQTMTV